MLPDASLTTAPLVQALLDQGIVRRIWARDPSVWLEGAGPDTADAGNIRNRLGWLEAPEAMEAELAGLRRLAGEVRAAGFRSALLLGMGGSSLCGEVLRTSAGPDGLRLHVLDTTDATVIRDAAPGDPGETLHLVASKSGTTIEVSALEAFFFTRASGRLGSGAGQHFIAITDEGTALARQAAQRGYRATFINPSDIGGRFSALSLFGLVPAAVMDVDVGELLAGAQAMARACRREDSGNPGLALGGFLAASAYAGRDKLTLLLPPALAPLGLWIEQLVAESTGKRGMGLLPVVDEPPGPVEVYGDDRAFVVFFREGDELPLADELERRGHPVFRLEMEPATLGAELFRWEFATAVAGAALAINPFDEPNVQEAKDRTRQVLDAFVRQGRFPRETAVASDPEIEVYGGRPAPSSAEALRAHIAAATAGNYVAFLSYLPASPATERALVDARIALQGRRRLATTSGVGPRYLHSTGQYHKGGPDGIIAVILTSESTTDTPVPGAAYSFERLRHAQALGDFAALEARGRRVLRIHVKAGIEPAGALARIFGEALT